MPYITKEKNKHLCHRAPRKSENTGRKFPPFQSFKGEIEAAFSL